MTTRAPVYDTATGLRIEWSEDTGEPMDERVDAVVRFLPDGTVEVRHPGHYPQQVHAGKSGRGPSVKVSPDDVAEAASAASEYAAEQAAKGRQVDIDNATVQAVAGKLAQARAVEPEVTEAVRRVVGIAGGETVGEEHKFKSAKSLVRKTLDKADARGVDPEAATADVKDALRFTGQVSTLDYGEGVQAAVQRLEADGYTIHKSKNFWRDSNLDRPAKAVNMQVKSPEGFIFELQWHTPESQEVKHTQLHPLYERYRDAAATPQQKALLKAEMAQIAKAAITAPEAAEDIIDTRGRTMSTRDVGSHGLTLGTWYFREDNAVYRHIVTENGVWDEVYNRNEDEWQDSDTLAKFILLAEGFLDDISEAEAAELLPDGAI